MRSRKNFNKFAGKYLHLDKISQPTKNATEITYISTYTRTICQKQIRSVHNFKQTY